MQKISVTYGAAGMKMWKT